METPLSTGAPAAQANPSRTWEVLCHVAALSAFIGVPFGNIAGPLIVWAMKRAEIPAVEHHGKEALNFQITASLAMIVLTAMGFFFALCAAIPVVGLLFWIPVALIALTGTVVLLGNLVLTIVATLKASEGVPYRYPFTIRFVK
jgi:hypothetical protein